MRTTRAKRKKLIRAVLIMALLCIIGGICLISAYEDKPIEDTVNYQIYIYPDGSATISVDNIGYVIQTDEDTPFGVGKYLQPGTLVIPGDGFKAVYEYPRRDSVNLNVDEGGNENGEE